MKTVRSLAAPRLLAVALLLSSPGCLILPTPEHALLQGRGAIPPELTGFVEAGVTTREEILLRFGEPDAVLRNGDVFAYRWMVAHGYVFVGAYYAGTAGPIPKNYLLLLEFEPSGVLRRWERRECIVHSPEKILEEWARPTDARPSK